MRGIPSTSQLVEQNKKLQEENQRLQNKVLRLDIDPARTQELEQKYNKLLEVSPLPHTYAQPHKHTCCRVVVRPRGACPVHSVSGSEPLNSEAEVRSCYECTVFTSTPRTADAQGSKRAM